MPFHISAQTFELCVLRFRYRTYDRSTRVAGITPNLLRGALGSAMKKLSEDDYQRYFAPRSEDGPSGLADTPRPFVLRLGEAGIIQLNVFAPDAVGVLTRAMQRIGMVEIEAIEQTGRTLPLAAVATTARRLRVHFLTPTELKPAGDPQFGILMARIRDRVSGLRALWGEGPLQMDFQAFGQRASAVKMTRCELNHIDGHRVSRGTGQKHPLGGFIGSVEYEGDVGEFLPYLEIARYTGVGRQTVWGKGEIRYEAS